MIFLIACGTQVSNEVDANEKLSELENNKINSCYDITFNNDEYILKLFDSNGDEYYRESYPKEPVINQVDKEILSITVSAGNPNSYVQYFNYADSEISGVYNNPLAFKENQIAYMEEGTLLVEDVFTNQRMIEIKRDFLETAVSSMAINNFEFIDSDEIQFEYLNIDNELIIENAKLGVYE